MRSRFILFLLSPLIFIILPSFFPPVIQGETLSPSLDLLIQEALDKSPMLKMGQNEVKSQEAAIGPKGSYEDPMVELGAMEYPEKDMRSHQISLIQKVPFPGKLTQLREAARDEFKAKEEMVQFQKFDLIREVKTHYYHLFLLHKKNDILQEQMQSLGQLISQGRNRFSLGKIPLAEVLNFQLEEGNLREKILDLQKEIKIKEGDLSHALGREFHHSPGKIRELKTTKINWEQMDKEKIREKVLEKNPGLKGRKWEVRSSEKNLDFSRKGYLPDFEFKVTYNRPAADDGRKDSYSGMVGISLPLWSSAKQSEEIKGALAEKSVREARLEGEKIHLLHRVHGLYAELEEALLRIKLYEGGILPLSKQAVMSGKAAYLTGRMEYGSFINLMRTNFQNEMSYQEALVQQEIKIAELEALLGDSLEKVP